MRRPRLPAGVTLLLCINPLVPFDASSATRRGRLTVEKLNQGGLPLVLSQTFRAIIHSRMKVGMERYERQYPAAQILLFEPDREDADMFFASIFSYAQRRKLCALAFAATRQNLRMRADSSRRSSRDTASVCAANASLTRRERSRTPCAIRARSSPTPGAAGTCAGPRASSSTRSTIWNAISPRPVRTYLIIGCTAR